MDVWAEFGIKTLSPSQIIKWTGDRGAWYASTRAKVYDDAGPAAWRGDAVEAGLFASLNGKPDAGRVAHDLFQLRAEEYAQKHDGAFHEDGDEEEAKIDATLSRAIEAWGKEKLGRPLAYQAKAEAFLPGTRIALYGKPDFAIPAPRCCVDLKTANQIPSQPKDANEKPQPKIEHAVAASFYAHARKEDEAKILYVSTAGKPQTTYRLITLDKTEIDFYVNATREIVKQIETTLLAAIAMSSFELVSKEDALAELCRPNMLAQGGGLYPIWRNEYAERARAAVPAWS
jgi:hypothetical protein